MASKYSNPFLDTFKHVFVAIFGYVSAYMVIGLYSTIFVGIGSYLIQKHNKPNTKLLKELQTGQYIGLVFGFLGILPFIQYFFISFAVEGGSMAFNSLFND